jgi:hypothetical protein
VKIAAQQDNRDPAKVFGTAAKRAKSLVQGLQCGRRAPPPPSMLTSSIINMYFSCQSILVWPSTRSPVKLGVVNRSKASFELDWTMSFEKPHAEWIVIPLIFAAAAPDVAVTSRRWDSPLLSKNSTTASMIRDFPVPPSPPTNWHSCGTLASP